MSTGSKPYHLHHYDSPEHQYSTAKLGIWLFMATEILMFGGLFVLYAIYKNKYPGIFIDGSRSLNWKLGMLNTGVLILSSFTMAMGIYYLQHNQKIKAVINLWITVACGAVFMVVKYFEWTHKFEHGIKAGKFFTAHDFSYSNQALYYSLYYTMTGLHGTHVLVGMGLIIWVAIKAAKGHFGSHYYTPVEGVGIFWHLVDLIWIYLFPLLYLIDMAR
ncbi:MAG: cytochrome C oxidase subunit III [Proteobacteria bacterium SG_bin7]|nr:MAG: cytochrome C oxidase subunit III [Proteobacteria bacterium SG_bin7]